MTFCLIWMKIRHSRITANWTYTRLINWLRIVRINSCPSSDTDLNLSFSTLAWLPKSEMEQNSFKNTKNKKSQTHLERFETIEQHRIHHRPGNIIVIKIKRMDKLKLRLLRSVLCRSFYWYSGTNRARRSYDDRGSSRLEDVFERLLNWCNRRI